ncbi:LicD family protein [Butyrivibrio sp. AD3002]|uniref:LicD family protein n=1 Tax=Butyrivibrio sp. AD3002 TaxID=1280670 RepID=UPI0009DB8D4F|nr:LicD family protein [Butyrivibrio sp. AD3002]
MMENIDTTKFMQDIELGILKEIDRVCKTEGIMYFVSGGTFLGAVRHNGFIPWDNDVDIGMFRDDYERFLKIAQDKFKEPYKLHTYTNYKEHHYYMSHVVDSRYSVRRLGSADKRVENIWVDVFPYDGLPNNVFIRNIHYFRLTFCRVMFHLAYFETVDRTRSDRTLVEMIAISICEFVSKWIRPNKKKWRERIDKLLKKYPLQQSNFIVNFIGVKRKKEIFSKEVFTNLVEYCFEGMTVLAPRDYDHVLSQLYGDYMTEPDDKDKATHPVEIV